MEIELFREKTNTLEHIFCEGSCVADLLMQLNINAETVLVVRNAEVLTADEKLHHNDSIKLLSVVSGG